MGSQAGINWKRVKFKFKKYILIGKSLETFAHIMQNGIIKRKKTQNLHKVALINMQQLPFGFVSS